MCCNMMVVNNDSCYGTQREVSGFDFRFYEVSINKMYLHVDPAANFHPRILLVSYSAFATAHCTAERLKKERTSIPLLHFLLASCNDKELQNF